MPTLWDQVTEEVLRPLGIQPTHRYCIRKNRTVDSRGVPIMAWGLPSDRRRASQDWLNSTRIGAHLMASSFSMPTKLSCCSRAIRIAGCRFTTPGATSLAYRQSMILRSGTMPFETDYGMSDVRSSPSCLGAGAQPCRALMPNGITGIRLGVDDADANAGEEVRQSSHSRRTVSALVLSVGDDSFWLKADSGLAWD